MRTGVSPRRSAAPRPARDASLAPAAICSPSWVPSNAPSATTPNHSGSIVGNDWPNAAARPGRQQGDPHERDRSPAGFARRHPVREQERGEEDRAAGTGEPESTPIDAPTSRPGSHGTLRPCVAASSLSACVALQKHADGGDQQHDAEQQATNFPSAAGLRGEERGGRGREHERQHVAPAHMAAAPPAKEADAADQQVQRQRGQGAPAPARSRAKVIEAM